MRPWPSKTLTGAKRPQEEIVGVTGAKGASAGNNAEGLAQAGRSAVLVGVDGYEADPGLRVDIGKFEGALDAPRAAVGMYDVHTAVVRRVRTIRIASAHELLPVRVSAAPIPDVGPQKL